MSYGLMAYRVDADKLKALCGSRDAALLTQLTGLTPEEFAAEEAEFGDAGVPDSSDEDPDPIWAIRDLIMGREMTLSGAAYGYGYKALIESLGTSLSNGLFYPADLEYLTNTVDPALTAAGTRLRMEALLFGGALVRFPPPDDFPMMGYWDAQEVAAGVAPLRAGADALPEVAAIREWCEAAAARGEAIVGFYH